MTSGELISLIVPIYKVEKYLDRCLESLINQTYKNIEIILVDDGSPDNSGIIAEEWKKKDCRVRVFHKPNGGLSSARNFGIEHARGKYLGFVDSDDYVSTFFVETLYSVICRYGTDIAVVGHFETTETGVPPIEEFDISKTELLSRHDAILGLYAPEKYHDYAWNKLYLKELFNDVKYPEGRLIEDQGTTYLLFEKCENIAYNPVKLYYYIKRADSITSRNDLKGRCDMYAMCKQKYVYVKEKYPDIEPNYRCFFSNCLDLFPYQEEKEQLWMKAELKELWPAVKASVDMKGRIKYFLCLNMSNLLSKICRFKVSRSA